MPPAPSGRLMPPAYSHYPSAYTYSKQDSDSESDSDDNAAVPNYMQRQQPLRAQSSGYDSDEEVKKALEQFRQMGEKV